MKTFSKITAFLLLACPLWAQVQLGGNVQVSGTTLICATPSEGTVATPTFSVAAGALSPGTTITGSTSTSGATIYYTLDGTTPAYDVNYMPTGTSHILGTAGTSGITAGNTFVPNFDPYGPMTIKMLAAKSSMTDSAVASASYTLTAATGTAISSCETIASAGTYYLSSNVSSTGTCFNITAQNVTLNLNGHTVTYGTAASTVLSGTDANVTSASNIVTLTTNTCTSGLVGDRVFLDNYNLGGYQNTGGPQMNQTIIGSCPTTSEMALVYQSGGSAFDVGFTGNGAEYYITGPQSFGVEINTNNANTGVKIYNGTFTQSANASPNSYPIFVDTGNQTGTPEIFSNLTFNISQPETIAVDMLYGTNSPIIQYNTVADSVTAIYDRDALPYPFYLGADQETANTPAQIHDNTVTGSPQGGVVTEWVASIINNNFNGGPSQYVNGYCGFSETNNVAIRGNTCTGNTRGWEIEDGHVTVQNNSSNLEDSAEVHDPNHAATGCEQSGGFTVRTKDYQIEAGNAASAVDNVIDSNEISATGGPCGATTIEFTILGTGDTTTISNNIISLDADQNSPASPNAIWGLDGGPDDPGQPAGWNGDASGLTYTGNTYSLSGTYASQTNAIYINFDGVANLTIPGLVSPLVTYRAGGSYSINSSATLTGTGSVTKSCIPGSTTIAATYNGIPLTCP